MTTVHLRDLNPRRAPISVGVAKSNSCWPGKSFRQSGQLRLGGSVRLFVSIPSTSTWRALFGCASIMAARSTHACRPARPQSVLLAGRLAGWPKRKPTRRLRAWPEYCQTPSCARLCMLAGAGPASGAPVWRGNLNKFATSARQPFAA